MTDVSKTQRYPNLVKAEKMTDLIDVFSGIRKGPILLVADEPTYQAAGKDASRILQDVGFAIKECILVRPTELVPDESALAEIRAACTEKFQYLLAVGSGSINDLMKHISDEKEIPLITLATAASMDGYTSSVAVLTIDGYKNTQKATPPVMVLSVAEVLNNAPESMTAAGIGDINK